VLFFENFSGILLVVHSTSIIGDNLKASSKLRDVIGQ